MVRTLGMEGDGRMPIQIERWDAVQFLIFPEMQKLVSLWFSRSLCMK